MCAPLLTAELPASVSELASFQAKDWARLTARLKKKDGLSHRLGRHLDDEESMDFRRQKCLGRVSQLKNATPEVV